MNDTLNLTLTTPEAWDLAAFLTTSKDPSLLAVGRRLEDQLRRIERQTQIIDDLRRQVLKEQEESLSGTGYMCTACAMPASGPGLSDCCGAPVVDTD